MDAVVSWSKGDTVMAEESVNSTNEQGYGEFSDAKPPRTIFIGKYGFPLREVILAGCLAAAVVVMIILIPFAAQAHRGEPAPPGPNHDLCLTNACLEAASYTVAGMDSSADPCSDFHKFACGNWKNSRPLMANMYERTIYTDLFVQNEEKLFRILYNTADTNWTMETKMRNIMSSCMNEQSRQMYGGSIFISKLIDTTGGWYVLGSFDENNYDINQYLKKVHGDFWTDVLFKFQVTTNQQDTKFKIIEVRYIFIILFYICT